MEFFVLGRDAEGVEDLLEALTEAHWGYLDPFAGRLRARGPLLSPDRSRHAGSMHIVDVPDVAAAYRFAYDEPFQRNGVFADLTVTRFVSCGDRSMYDDRRPLARPATSASTLVIARWDTEPTSPRRHDDLAEAADETSEDPWVFLGLLLSDDGSDCIGAVGALDLRQDAAVPAFMAALAAAGRDAVEAVAWPWQRGGRPARPSS